MSGVTGAYITHNATQLLSDITGDSVSHYMQLPLEPQKNVYYSIHTCSSTPQHL